MDNKHRKLFVIKQSKGFKVMFKMHVNVSATARKDEIQRDNISPAVVPSNTMNHTFADLS